MSVNDDVNHIDFSRSGHGRSNNGPDTGKLYSALTEKRAKLIAENRKLTQAYNDTLNFGSKRNQTSCDFQKRSKIDPHLFSKHNEAKLQRARKRIKARLYKNIQAIHAVSQKVAGIRRQYAKQMPSDPEGDRAKFRDDEYATWKRDYEASRFKNQYYWKHNHAKLVPTVFNPNDAHADLNRQIFLYGRHARVQRTYYLDHPDKIGLDQLLYVPGLARALGVDDTQPQHGYYKEHRDFLHARWNPAYASGKPGLKAHFRDHVIKPLKYAPKIHYGGYSNQQARENQMLGGKDFTDGEVHKIMQRPALRKAFGFRSPKYDISRDTKTADNALDVQNASADGHYQSQRGMAYSKSHAGRIRKHAIFSQQGSDLIDQETGKSPLVKKLRYQHTADAAYHKSELDQAKRDVIESVRNLQQAKAASIKGKNRSKAFQLGHSSKQVDVDRKVRIKILKQRIHNIQAQKKSNTVDRLNASGTVKDPQADKEVKQLQNKIQAIQKAKQRENQQSNNVKRYEKEVKAAKKHYKAVNKQTVPNFDLATMIRKDTDYQREARYQKRLALKRRLEKYTVQRENYRRIYKNIYPKSLKSSRSIMAARKRKAAVAAELEDLAKQHKQDLKKKKHYQKLDHAFPSKKLMSDLKDQYLQNFVGKDGKIDYAKYPPKEIERDTNSFMHTARDKMTFDYAKRNVPVKYALKKRQKSLDGGIQPSMTWGQAFMEILKPGVTETYGIGDDPGTKLDPIDVSDLVYNQPRGWKRHFLRTPGKEPDTLGAHLHANWDRHKLREDNAYGPHGHLSDSSLLNDQDDYFGNPGGGFNNNPGNGGAPSGAGAAPKADGPDL